jgi:hypothetical protein
MGVATRLHSRGAEGWPAQMCRRRKTWPGGRGEYWYDITFGYNSVMCRV